MKTLIGGLLFWLGVPLCFLAYAHLSDDKGERFPQEYSDAVMRNHAEPRGTTRQRIRHRELAAAAQLCGELPPGIHVRWPQELLDRVDLDNPTPCQRGVLLGWSTPDNDGHLLGFDDDSLKLIERLALDVTR